MAIYSVGYDLKKQKDYPRLTEAIKKTGSWAHVGGSHWFIESNEDPLALVTRLEKCLDSDDVLFVVSVGSNVAWTDSLSRDVQEWLKNAFARLKRAA